MKRNLTQSQLRLVADAYFMLDDLIGEQEMNDNTPYSRGFRDGLKAASDNLVALMMDYVVGDEENNGMKEAQEQAISLVELADRLADDLSETDRLNMARMLQDAADYVSDWKSAYMDK